MSTYQPQRALELFSQKFNCAQSTYGACAKNGGLSEAQRLALTAPFGGGVARQGEICGALTGALLAIGETAGAAMATDPVTGRKALYEQVHQFTEAFRAAHGSILCRELTGVALDTEEGQSIYNERGTHQNLCSKLVTYAVEQVNATLAAVPPQE